MKNIVQFARRNNRLKIFLAVLLLILTAGTPVTAKEISARERLFDYINLSFYEKRLFQAAAAEAMKEIACGKPGTKVMRTKMKVLSKIRFTKKRVHPVEGIWREETHVILCGKSMDVNVTVVATPKGSPAFLAKKD